MEASKDYGPEPVRKDLGMLLVLAAVCPFGILMWAFLFSALQWTVVGVWDLAVGVVAHHPAFTATGLAHDLSPVPAAALRPDPSLPTVKPPEPGRAAPS